jgi:hypothetical protein
LNSPLLVGGISIATTILTVSPFRSSVVQSLINVALTDPNKQARRAKGETRRMLSWSFGFVSHEGTPNYLQPCRRCNRFTERRVNQAGDCRSLGQPRRYPGLDYSTELCNSELRCHTSLYFLQFHSTRCQRMPGNIQSDSKA